MSATAVQLSAVVAHPVVYPVTEAEIAAARQKYAALTADTKEGYEEVRLALGRLRTARTSIEARRKELKADSLEYGRRVDSAAKKLTAMVEEIEQPLQAKKDAVDQTEAQAKRAAEDAARAEAEAKAKAERDAENARLAAERQRQEAVAAEQRAAQAKIDADRAALDSQREAIEAQQREAARVEEQRLAAARAEQEAKEQAERDRVEAEAAVVAAAAEALRLAALAPDLDKAVAFAAEIRQLARRAPLLGQEPGQAIEWAAGRLEFVAAAIEKRMAEIKGAA